MSREKPHCFYRMPAKCTGAFAYQLTLIFNVLNCPSSLHLFEILKNLLCYQFKFGYEKTMVLALLPWITVIVLIPPFLQPQASLLGPVGLFQPSGKGDGAKKSDKKGKARGKDRVRGGRNTLLSLFLSSSFLPLFPSFSLCSLHFAPLFTIWTSWTD